MRRWILVVGALVVVLATISVALVLVTGGTGTVITDQYALNGVSCASERFCVAVASDGRAFTYAGGRWSGPQVADPYTFVDQTGQRHRNDLATVSCTTSNSGNSCTAVDDSSYTVRYVDGHWHGGPKIGAEPSDLGTSISCPTTRFCMAVDAAGHALTDVHGRWSAPYKLPYAAALTSVSCATPQFCVTVDAQGDAFVISHGTWSIETIDTNSGTQYDSQGGLHDVNKLTSVSCATPWFCMAVGDAGYAFSYADGTWSPGQRVDTHGVPNTKGTATANFSSVSCPTPQFCMAVDQLGYAFVYDHGHWQAGQHVDSHANEFGAVGLVSVSCPTASSCVAVDPAGHGYTLSQEEARAGEPVALSRDAQAVRQVISSLAVQDVGVVAAAHGLQSGIRFSVAGDLASAHGELERALAAAGQGHLGTACADAAGLSGDLPTARQDRGLASGVDWDLGEISNSVAMLQSDVAALEQAQAAQPRASRPQGPLPDPSEVSQAIVHANAASLQAVSIANGFIDQANSNVQTAYQYLAEAIQAGHCSGIGPDVPPPPEPHAAPSRLRGRFPSPM